MRYVGTVLACILVPSVARAQGAADTALLYLPAGTPITCQQEKAPASAGALAGARAFMYDIGTPAVQVRVPGAPVMSGPTPREITLVLDSAGRPALLTDMQQIALGRQASVLVVFTAERRPSGYWEIAVTDTAAVMARIRRDGLRAMDDAIQAATQRQRGPLDSLALDRASQLAQLLLTRGCVSNPAPVGAVPPWERGPTTLAGLLATYRQFPDSAGIPAQLPRCELPVVAPGSDWVTLPGPDDSLTLRLPAGWTAALVESAFGGPRRVYHGPDGGRVGARAASGPSGRPVLAMGAPGGRPTELPGAHMCQVGEGPAGAIWTLYPPVPGVTTGPYTQFNAIGDLITVRGGRYAVDIRAASAEARDSLVRIVTGAP